jgi:hypothetical protein
MPTSDSEMPPATKSTKKQRPEKSSGNNNTTPTEKSSPKATIAKKAPKSTKDSGEPKPKRGPARPHRRLAAEVIDSRIAKLQKRLDRAKSQIEDAGRHVEGYLRERDFRDKEAANNNNNAAPPIAEHA